MLANEDVLRERLDRLLRIGDNPALQKIERELCRRDFFHFCRYWVWTYDPRLASEGKSAHLPLLLFPRQVEMCEFVDARLSAREDGLIEKSRDIGFTWVMAAKAEHKWLFVPGFKTTFGSRVESLIDKRGEVDSIFEKLRYILRSLPPWLCPTGFNWSEHDNHMRLINPENNNTIAGEAGEDIGRGGRSSMLVIDEAAFLSNGDSVDAATSGNSDVRIWGSSVKGMGNLFAKKRHGGSLRPDQIFTFHWAQPLDAKILTPAGWTVMGDVKIGDSVIGSSGVPVEVTDVTFHGEKSIYRVTFNDKTSTECCGDHLWAVIPYGNQRKGRKHMTKVMSTEEMLRDYVSFDSRGFREHRYQIPLTKPVVFESTSLPLHPYVMGVLLGDGSFPKNTIRPIVLASTDSEIAERVSQLLPSGCRLSPVEGIHYRFVAEKSQRGGIAGRGHHNPVNALSRELGLSGTESHTKFVPGMYLFSSPSDRLELLRGLLDTDGSVVKTDPGCASFSTTSPQLRDAVVFLAQSLGGTATIRVRPPSVRQILDNAKPSFCRESYTVHVRLPDEYVPFHLSRKVAAFVKSKKGVRRTVVGIEKVGTKPCQCIAVSAEDGLYLTDSMIVTHNSHDPRKTPEWAAKKQRALEPHIWASEYELDYSASVEGICIPSKWVKAAMALAELYPYTPNSNGIAGLDVGAGGSGKSVFVARFGPKVLPPIGWGNPDTIETAHRALDEAAKINIPRGNGFESKVTILAYDSPGVGQGVQSALRHTKVHGLNTVATNTGESPSDVEWPDGQTSEAKFLNLRAELWWTMRARFKASYELWLLLTGQPDGQPHPISECVLLPAIDAGPDTQAMVSQISLPRWHRNDKGKIVIESKKSMRDRGLASPDHADALALTYLPNPDPLEIWRKIGSRG